MRKPNENAILRCLQRVEIALSQGHIGEAHVAISEAFIPEIADPIDDNSPIACLGLPVRTVNLLERNKITTVGRLRKSSPLELLALCNLAETGVAQIELTLAGYGLQLRKEQASG